MDPVAKGFESSSRLVDRVGVEIESDQKTIGCGRFENGFGVATAAERAIDDDGTGRQIELSKSFSEKDGLVVRMGRHDGRLPSIRSLGTVSLFVSSREF